MQISSLTFKTIQSLVGALSIAGSICSCSMNLEDRGMKEQIEQTAKAKDLTKSLGDATGLTDETLKKRLGINEVDKNNYEQNPTSAKITQYMEHLNLIRSENKLTCLSALYISCCNFNSLQYIMITDTKIGNMGCKYLSKSKTIYLNTIDLSSCEIGYAGIYHLSKASWKHLKHLDLGENYFHSEGIEKISRAVYKLEGLDLFRNKSNLDLYTISRVISMFNNNDLRDLIMMDKTSLPMNHQLNINNKFPNLFD